MGGHGNRKRADMLKMILWVPDCDCGLWVSIVFGVSGLFCFWGPKLKISVFSF